MPTDSAEYYNLNADKFFQETANIDMGDFYRVLEKYLPLDGTISILDAGCGSGRDSKYFLSKGFLVHAFDASQEMCDLASNYIGQSVSKMSFSDLNEFEKYDAIWACASLLHLPKEVLVDVFRRFYQALKPNGVIYCSFKYGDFEGVRNGRYFTDFTQQSFGRFLSELNLKPLELWVTSDLRVGREAERWLNALLKN
jgi:SAM-dependent methyltransferase